MLAFLEGFCSVQYFFKHRNIGFLKACLLYSISLHSTVYPAVLQLCRAYEWYDQND